MANQHYNENSKFIIFQFKKVSKEINNNRFRAQRTNLNDEFQKRLMRVSNAWNNEGM